MAKRRTKKEPPKRKDSIVIPVQRGIQNGREFYVSMVSIQQLIKLMTLDYGALPPAQRAQRAVNMSRAKKLANYVKEDYWILPGITVSMSPPFGEYPHFISMEGFIGSGQSTEGGIVPTGAEVSDFGLLAVSKDTIFLVNDGQTRTKGLELATAEEQGLLDENMVASFYLDLGLERAQTIISDINNNGKSTSKSLNILYDHRDPMAKILRTALKDLAPDNHFLGRINLEKGSIGKRSKEFWTLAGIYDAFVALFPGMGVNLGIDRTRDDLQTEDLHKFIPEYRQLLNSLWKEFTHWHFVDGVSALEVRAKYMSATQLGLMAICRYIGADYQKRRNHIPLIAKIDWERSNPDFDGMILIDGAIVKTKKSLLALVEYIADQVYKQQQNNDDSTKK